MHGPRRAIKAKKTQADVEVMLLLIICKAPFEEDISLAEQARVNV